MDGSNDSIQERIARAERAIQRESLARRIRELGGYVPEMTRDQASELEISFLARVLAWETGPFATHGEWLARQGLVFPPPEELRGQRLASELWRLIEALAVARVFLYHTDHLTDAELYRRLCEEVLEASAPDFARTADDACHWDFADPGSGDEQLWLACYASEDERQAWVREFSDVILPPKRMAPPRRDHRLPVRD